MPRRDRGGAEAIADVSQPPRNNLTWRVGRLEDDVKELQRGQPAVMAERVAHLSEDVTELRNDIKGLRRVIAGAFTGLGLVIAAAVVAQIITGG